MSHETRKELILYKFKQVSKTKFLFKAGLVSAAAFIVVSSAISARIIASLSKANLELSNSIRDIGSMKLYLQSVSYYVRVVSLIDQGILDSSNRKTYFDWLESDIDKMNQGMLSLYKNHKSLTGHQTNHFLAQKVLIWTKPNRVKSISMNLFDTISSFVVQSAVFKEKFYASNATLADKRAFYLYRNGMGEVLQALNQSSVVYSDIANLSTESEYYIAVALVSLSALVLCAFSGFVILPSIKRILDSKAEAYKVLFEVPDYACGLMRSKFDERLNLLESCQSDISDKKQASTPCGWKLVLAKLSCFLLSAVLFLYLMYYTGFESIVETLNEKPKHVEWAARRRLLSRSINMWVTESILQNTTLGWAGVLPKGQFIGSALNQAYLLSSELEDIQDSLVFREAAFSKAASPEHNSLVFENACVEDKLRGDANCSEVGDQIMLQGLHSSVRFYTMLARSIMDSQSKFLNSKEMVLLRELDEKYLYDALDKSSELYCKDSQEQVEGVKFLQDLTIIVFCLVSAFLFLVVHFPMIEDLSEEATCIWSMCALLPEEYQEDYTKLNQLLKLNKYKIS